MREHLLPSEYIDLSHPRSLGPLFDQARAHLAECQECRRLWTQGEALKALALESGPEVPRVLTKTALLEARRAAVDEAVRELPGPGAGELERDALLHRSELLRPGLRPWIPALGALAAGLMLFFSMSAPKSPAPPAAAQAEQPALPFEFDQRTPAPEDPREAALDDEARAMLIAHLSGENRASPEPTRAANSYGPLVSPAPTAEPTLPPTRIPTPAPAATSTPLPRPTPTALPARPPSLPLIRTSPEFSLENAKFEPLLGAQAVFRMVFPDEGSLEIRIFDASGRSVRLLADGRFAAGNVELRFDGKDDAGAPLPPGAYYARVMTRWYSRVEALEVRP